jgi:hypothetical protein
MTCRGRAQSRARYAALLTDRYPTIPAGAPRFYTDADTHYLYGLDLLLAAILPAAHE